MKMKERLEKILDEQLEEYLFEEFLELFDLTPLDVFKVIYDAGLIDEDILDRMVPSDL